MKIQVGATPIAIFQADADISQYLKIMTSRNKFLATLPSYYMIKLEIYELKFVYL